MGNKKDQANKTGPPDLEKFIKPEWKHQYLTYMQGARMFDLNYWTFVRLAKEAGANLTLRKTAVVDLSILEEYMDAEKLEETKTSKGVIVADKKDIQKMNDLVKAGKKYMRSDEAMVYFSVGKHTLEKWAKQAKAIYKINGVKLINIEKIERFIEAFLEEDD